MAFDGSGTTAARDAVMVEAAAGRQKARPSVEYDTDGLAGPGFQLACAIRRWPRWL